MPSAYSNGIFEVQPYGGVLPDKRAGFTEAWYFHLARIWCYLAINLQMHVDQICHSFYIPILRQVRHGQHLDEAF